MTVAKTSRRKASDAPAGTDAPLAELNARPAPSEAPATASAAPSPASSPAPAVSPAAPADGGDPFALLVPGGRSLFEAMDGPRPRRWLIAAKGSSVSAAWDAWRAAEPTGSPDAFVALVGRALGDAPEAVARLDVVRVRV